jgi:wobble nucleotide-excising tRNase
MAHHFDWNHSVLGRDHRPLQLKRLNIIFGRNYSGKTTLSRILRSLETGIISDKYDSPEYTITLQDETTISHTSVTTHSLVVRVFNEDFVREHLAVFTMRMTISLPLRFSERTMPTLSKHYRKKRRNSEAKILLAAFGVW